MFKSFANKKLLLLIALFPVVLIIAKLLLPLIAEPLIGKSLLLNPSGYSRLVYANKGELLKVTLSSDDKIRIWTPLKQISPALIESTLLQEDRYFYWHPGINPLAIIKGAWSTYFSGAKVGASTITMQLARLRYGIKSRSIFGKINQIAHALLLESLYSKDSILEAYLNIAPYGGNIEGVGAAALTYFGKDASNLNWPESISLSVIPQDPNNRIPANNQISFQQARERLYLRAKANGLLSDQLFNSDYPAMRKEQLPYLAPHFVQRALSTYPNDQKVYTSLNLGLQARLERLVNTYIERNHKIGITNAEVLLIESENMKTRAYLGSADFWSKDILGQNDGIIARRSPGSALKPFLYGLAIDQGIIHPGSLLKDTEFSRASYNPENYERDFVGPINATDALIRSRNVPAVMLLNELSPARFYKFLQDANIAKLKNENFYGLSMILGGAEVRMDELAALYAMLSRSGSLDPISIFEKSEIKPKSEAKQLLSPEASALVLKMLDENPRPLSAFDSSQTTRSLSVAWKTGTSFGFRDAWAAGVIGPYTLLVWIGNFDSAGNPSFVGRDAAGPLFFAIVDAISSDQNLKQPLPKQALNIKKVKVCSVSGELPGPFCKHLKDSWFIPGKSPIHSCDIHREIIINPNNNLRICPSDSTPGIKKIVEFWPSDLMDLFNRAGLPRAIPAQFEKSCQNEIFSGKAPLISSPQTNIIYQLESGRSSIPLSAVTDGDSIRTYWFVDDSFIADTAPSDTFFWKASSGEFVVRAIDSQGRANQVLVKVQANL